MNNPPPTKSVRVTVPVSPEVLDTFQRLAKAGGMSTGKAMGEWLGDTIDAAEFMASKMEQARSTPKLVARELHSYALGLTDMTQGLMESMKKAPKGASGERSGAATAAPLAPFGMKAKPTLTPPSSNTGGKVPKNPKNEGGSK